MTARATLLTYFQTGDTPTQAQFIELINSIFNLTDDDWEDIPGLAAVIAAKAAATHTHAISDVTGLQDALNTLIGGVKWKGTWNANTNSPSIPAASSTNAGWYYKVGTAGTTTIDGIGEWAVTDWIISNGTVWEKVDNTDKVTSVAGKTGNVTLAQADITNLVTDLATLAADIATAQSTANLRAEANGAAVIGTHNETAKKGFLLIKADTTSGNVTINLDDNIKAREVLVWAIIPGSNTVTINPYSGNMFEGSITPITLTTNYEKKRFHFTGDASSDIAVS